MTACRGIDRSAPRSNTEITPLRPAGAVVPLDPVRLMLTGPMEHTGHNRASAGGQAAVSVITRRGVVSTEAMACAKDRLAATFPNTGS
jgi:hypothetical protein